MDEVIKSKKDIIDKKMLISIIKKKMFYDFVGLILIELMPETWEEFTLEELEQLQKKSNEKC